MNRADCLRALEEFAKRLHRFKETSDPCHFDCKEEDGEPDLQNIRVVFCVEGSFGVATNIFEAIRVLGGFKLPREGRRAKPQPGHAGG